MALIKDFTNSTGQVFDGAHWRIKEDGLKGGKHEMLVTLEIREAKDSSYTVGSVSFSFVPDMSKGNYHEQAYAHFKSLKGFSDCVDC